MRFEMAILVNGRRIRQYHHRGKVHVEGRRESSYEIELKNSTPDRVLAVVSVDGLSVMDGKKADPKDVQGYIVRPHSAMTIPGWRLDDGNVAKFTFGGRGDAYAASKGRKAKRNIGVIGCAIFKEKPCMWFTGIDVERGPWTRRPDPWPYRERYPGKPFFSQTTDADPNVVRESRTTENLFVHVERDDDFPEECAAVLTYNADCDGAPVSTYTTHASLDAGEPGTLNIGTEFGRQAGHEVMSVPFDNEATPASMMEIVYSDRAGLERMGVDLRQRTSRRYSAPEAFPGTGCRPPAGWDG